MILSALYMRLLIYSRLVLAVFKVWLFLRSLLFHQIRTAVPGLSNFFICDHIDDLSKNPQTVRLRLHLYNFAFQGKRILCNDRGIYPLAFHCMKSGAVFGSACAIDGMIERMEAELGGRAALIATGGLAGRIIPYCRHDIEIDDYMLLRGLSLIWQRNRRDKRREAK